VSRTLSSAFLEAIFAQSTDEVFVLLVTISHPELTTPIRLAANSEDIVSNGWTYFGVPIEVDLPADEEDAPPSAKLRIDAVDQDIIRAARSIRTRPNVELQVILADNPDVVEIQLPVFNLVRLTYDAFQIVAELQVDDLLIEPYPAGTFSPAIFRAIF
jgi:hypothetical protein